MVPQLSCPSYPPTRTPVPRIAAWVLCLIGTCSCTSREDAAPLLKEPTHGRPQALVKDHDDATALRTQSSADYVDDKLCAECHGEVWESYQALGMARSLSPFDATTAIESFTQQDAQFYHPLSDMHFSMLVRQGRMVVRRYRQRPDGTPINVREQEVDYVIGSGNHVRGYLYRNPAGELFEIPIVWYTQEQSWGMAPGYDLVGHQDFDRPITRQCMGCHNAYPEYAAGEDAWAAAAVFPAALPHGIGCQRCHGPGGHHVQLAESQGVSLEAVRQSIVNPSHLAAARRDAVCLQCHLQPMSRRTSLVRASGQGDYEFKPGDSLDEHVAYLELDEQTEDADRFEINHHAYRLFQSACYRGSDGALSCLSCHDPHTAIAASQRVEHYRARCLSCHKQDDCLDVPHGRAPNADCVACHMPLRRTQDVVHVVMTDHKIARRSKLAEPEASIPEEELASELPIRPYSWSGQLAHVDQRRLPLTLARLRDRDPTLLEALQWPLPGMTDLPPQPLLELGIEVAQAQLVSGQFAAAAETLSQLNPLGIQTSFVRMHLGAALVRLGRYDQAIVELQAALHEQPNRPETHYNLGLAGARLDRLQEAADHYRRAIELRPTYAKAHFNLGNLRARAGQWDEAAEAFQRVLALTPNFAPGYKNLSAVWRREHAWSKSLQVLQDGHRAVPHSGAILHDLYLLYTGVDHASLQDWRRALHVAQQSCQRQPDDGRARLMLALAQAMSQRPDDALRSVSAALQASAVPAQAALVAAIAQQRLGEHQAAQRNFEAGWEGTSAASSSRWLRAIRSAAQATFE